MALVFWDGGEGYRSTVDLQAKWTALGATQPIFTSGTTVRSGALGTRSLDRASNPSVQGNKISVSLSTIFVEFWWQPITTNATLDTVMGLLNASATQHMSVRRTSDGGSNTVLRWYNAAAAQVGSDYLVGAALTWVHVAVKCVISDTGSITIKIDDNLVVDALSGDFFSSGALTHVVFHTASGSGDCRFDDIVIQDQDGAFLGSKMHCVGAFPTAAGDSTALTPSAGSNWENVDEADPDDDTTYNSSATAGHRDLYNITDLPTYNGNVLGVDVWGRMRKDNGGTEQAKLAIKTNSTVYYGSDESLTNSYAPYRKQYLVNPNTGVAFTQAEINALQVGVEVV